MRSDSTHPLIILPERSSVWFGQPRTGELVYAESAPDPNWVQVCSRCIYDERVGGITFSATGLCRYCDQVDELTSLYGTGSSIGTSLLEAKLDQIRYKGKHHQFDCVIGVSGGTDSSYLVRMARKEWGLRPLAVHYDNTWSTGVAAQNIANVLRAYGVPLYTYVANHAAVDRIFRAFFYSGVAELEASTDLAFAYILRMVARKHRIPYILEGHSFIAEGVSPLNNNYFDGRYIRSIVRYAESVGAVGSEPTVMPDNQYPLMTLTRFLRETLVGGSSLIRPLWFLDYDKESAKRLLEEEAEWSDYGGHHLENRMTSFYHTVYLPTKFGSDFRNNSLSALARQSAENRRQAWSEYCRGPNVEPGLVDYFRERLGIPEEEYSRVMSEPGRSWHEFATYKRTFEWLRPLFWLLMKRDRVTRSFYLKYCTR